MKFVKINNSRGIIGQEKPVNIRNKAAVLRFFLVLAGVLVIGRLFMVQIIKHDYYSGQALAEHEKQYQLPAKRGLIYAYDGDKQVPIVLNEVRYEIYADPKMIQDKDKVASAIAEITGEPKDQVKQKIADDKKRFVILAKKATEAQKNTILALKDKGIGYKEVSIRSYPQGQFASQVLGFVNDDQVGQYGIEQALDKQLAGEKGQLKAITDVNGVPLAINNDNIQKQPKSGKPVVLTLDIGMQKLTEDALNDAITRTRANSATALILDANNGQVKAMANYPSYNPADYQKVPDASVFTNEAVSGAWEPGSVMKPIIMSTAFNQGTLNPGSTFYDSMSVQVDDRKINNSYPWGAQTMSMQDIITKSLNTGAVYILKSLGGGDINSQARSVFYDYLTNRFWFGKPTGIEQTGESAGTVGGPEDGYGLRVRYANMSFGQGLTVTPLQLANAYAALVNGGVYYQPTLVASVDGQANRPVVKQSSVIKPETSAQIKNILKTALETNNKNAVRTGYDLGAKTGTAEIADGSGNYKKDDYNGVYVGFISGQDKSYIMIVRLDEPKSARFASSEAATTWTDISNKILDSYAIRPKN
jgi:cell division protein FtsI/penicillin-binding protein 2